MIPPTENDKQTIFPDEYDGAIRNPLLVEDVKLSWRHAILALNNAQNSGNLESIANDLERVVVQLSQILEFIESMSPESVAELMRDE